MNLTNLLLVVACEIVVRDGQASGIALAQPLALLQPIQGFLILVQPKQVDGVEVGQVAQFNARVGELYRRVPKLVRCNLLRLTS